MNPPKKDLLELAADAFTDGVRKVAAHTGAKIVREIAKGAGQLAAELDKEALCECTPTAAVSIVRGRPRTVLTHQKGCPAA